MAVNPPRSRALVYAGIVVLALAIGGYAMRRTPAPANNAHRAAPRATTANATPVSPPRDVAAAAPAQRAAPIEDATAEWQAFMRFKSRMDVFLRDGAKLAPQQRREEAAALREDVRRYAEDRHLSGGEAMMLEVALVQNSVDDPADVARQAGDIAAHYRTAAEQAAEARAATPDPRFLDYKAREKEIVARVSAMSDIPGGIDRDEYLRQQLQAARVEAYRQ